MALRDQPYLPLYIQDYMTDEKLNECSAEANGVFVRIMMLMHKSETYGKILLNQKHKQTTNQIENFALMFGKHFPYTFDEIMRGLTELINERVVYLEEDFLCQKRMIRDGQLSEIRSNAGKKGGKKSSSNDEYFGIAKTQANTEYENEIHIEDNSNISLVLSLEDREQKFKSECEQFRDRYGGMIDDFVRYWTEPNKSKTKMRYEKESTWELSRRLTTWDNNNKTNFGRNNGSATNSTNKKQTLGEHGTRTSTL